MKRFKISYRFLGVALMVAVLFSFIFQGCDKSGDEVEIIPQADFSYTNNELLVDDAIVFVNSTSNTNSSTKYYWNFGDGTSSSQENPVHTYSEPGIYLVVLKATNSEADSTRKTMEIMVSLSNHVPGRMGLRERFNTLNNDVLVCAHRGNHKNLPENSIAAINKSIEENIAFAEIDIRQSKDGELVLMHDNTIDRTTNGSGKVNDLTLAELRQLNLEHNGNLTSQIIPTFAEILQLSRGKIYLDLDVKMENFIKVYNVVKLYGMIDQVMFTVDDVVTAKSLVNNDERVIVMPIVRNQDDFDLYTHSNLNLAVLHYNSASFTQGLISQAHQQNLQVFRLVYVNSTTTPNSDSFKQINELIELKGNIVQTDYPVEVKSYLQNKKLN